MIEDEYWMRFAIMEAEKALDRGEVPIGAVIVKNNSIIGRGYNSRENLKDPTAHAEIIAITSASQTLGSWKLEGTSIYITLEPCPMCAGAILNARIDRVVFGAYDENYGACGSTDNILDGRYLNHKPFVKGGVLENQCQALLRTFFKNLRDRN
ncbi:MAG: nucleoside deaminase [Candidatus Marinimicrobia bacterium]|nr:nucleoside deaminase [Candidatus Neomarinimicrobiota bacterium]